MKLMFKSIVRTLLFLSSVYVTSVHTLNKELQENSVLTEITQFSDDVSKVALISEGLGAAFIV